MTRTGAGVPPIASLEHLIAVEAKIEALQRTMLETADQIATQIGRESDRWCPCRVTATLGVVSAEGRNYIASRLGAESFSHLEGLTKPCVCEDLWIAGAMPVDVSLPSRPGVYICFDIDDRCAYIGTSLNNVKGRLQFHFRDPDKPRLGRWAAFFPGKFGESAAPLGGAAHRGAPAIPQPPTCRQCT